MSSAVKHMAVALVFILMLAGFALLHSCVAHENSRRLCDRLDVRIKGTLEFVTEEDVRGYLDRRYGCYIGAPLDSINLGRIESLLAEKNVVRKGEAWTTRDGVLHVSIEQRAPAIRFMRGDKGFYIDREGSIIPLHPAYTAPVPVVEGAIPALEKGEKPEWGMKMLGMTDFIASSKDWKDKVEKISVNGNGDVEIKIADSGERFIFGEPDEIESKFARMAKYYSHIVPDKGEGYYKSVNLKYNKQIICRKDT